MNTPFFRVFDKNPLVSRGRSEENDGREIIPACRGKVQLDLTQLDQQVLGVDRFTRTRVQRMHRRGRCRSTQFEQIHTPWQKQLALGAFHDYKAAILLDFKRFKTTLKVYA